MKRTTKIAVGIAASLGLGLAVATAHAHPWGMGGGMGPGAGMHHGMMGGMGPGAAQQLMTPEEQTAMREKMRAAKTPEERQALALANRAEMEKRAKEKGVTLPEARGHHGGRGHGFPGTAGQQLMTPEEQTAMREKMRSAATPEERQKLALANRAEMEKRAKEKGITLPEARGSHGGHGHGHGYGYGYGLR